MELMTPRSERNLHALYIEEATDYGMSENCFIPRRKHQKHIDQSHELEGEAMLDVYSRSGSILSSLLDCVSS